MTSHNHFLEIHYSLRGRTLPADHGYALYSAIKKQLQQLGRPDLPSDIPSDLRLSSIAGIPNGEGMIYLNRASRFRLRCPTDQVQTWYRFFQNQVLDIQGHLIRLVQPRITLPEPSGTLAARLVTFKLEAIDHLEVPRYFLESCQKGLTHLGIQGKVFIPSDPNGDLARRTIQVKGKKVVGYRVIVEDLTPEDSLKLQWHGLGGRRHFGCGWFYPVKEEPNAA
ncbi:type I-MYXAN CRISPR-associated protein Cas6/Cmx6 [Thermosynechococcus sp. QKsg1]|uniref:type I-MYXAN CRISPR-associated protein Cas6/Cmx6 n=1 Tax=Thermosynechococcus sp. QKsg1 TaxID=3074130 RepID=UPI00287776D9|nr:type I-MYXAN CRISPR-associated protein Cas6/Cmx6 [Thermosynechococcus sp. QKsg1]WNC87187.1 type I-MYXAN CRISPR-associated protein Cas6/Cmx6 [Thermosynechococcus sp. QKsg1]